MFITSCSLTLVLLCLALDFCSSGSSSSGSISSSSSICGVAVVDIIAFIASTIKGIARKVADRRVQ